MVLLTVLRRYIRPSSAAQPLCRPTFLGIQPHPNCWKLKNRISPKARRRVGGGILELFAICFFYCSHKTTIPIWLLSRLFKPPLYLSDTRTSRPVYVASHFNIRGLLTRQLLFYCKLQKVLQQTTNGSQLGLVGHVPLLLFLISISPVANTDFSTPAGYSLGTSIEVLPIDQCQSSNRDITFGVPRPHILVSVKDYSLGDSSTRPFCILTVPIKRSIRTVSVLPSRLCP